MAPDKSFGILLAASAIGALWLYNTGRLNAVWTAIQGGAGAPVVYPPSAPGGAPIPKADVLVIPPARAGSVAPAIVSPGNLPPILPGGYHVVNGVYYA